MPEKKNTIGRFEIIEKIGEGPIGAVYKALDPVIRRTVAIKVVKLYALEETTTFAEVFEKIYRVIRTSTSLNHPNICIIYDLSEEKKIPFITMEYVEGQDLDELLQKKHQFKRVQLLNILSQVCDALDFAHKKGVIHQDLKTTNILVTPELVVKITDFGIAGLDEIAAAQTKKLLSIPFYISPEHAIGGKITPASDIFSLGVIVYQLLSGELPFRGNTAANVIMTIAKEPPAVPKHLEKSGINRSEWDNFFATALAKSPEQRFSTAGDLFEALNGIVPPSDHSYFPYSFSGSENDRTGEFEKTFVGETSSPTVMLDAKQLLQSMEEKKEPEPVPQAAAELPEITPVAPEEPPPMPVEPSPVTQPPVAAEVASDVPEEEFAQTMMASPQPMEASPAVQSNDQTSDQRKAPAAQLIEMPPEYQEDVVAKSNGSGNTSPPTQQMMQSQAEPALEPTLPPVPESSRPTALLQGTGAVVDSQPPAVMDPIPAQAPRTMPPQPQQVPQPQRMAPKKAAGPPNLKLYLIGALVIALFIVLVSAYIFTRGTRSAENAAQNPEQQAKTSSKHSASTPSTTSNSSQEPAGVTIETPAVAGKISIVSTPPGAKVMVNGEQKGVTPLELSDMPAGQYALLLQLNGYKDVQQIVDINDQNQTANVESTLEKAAPVAGTLVVESTPSDAFIVIGNRVIGVTPKTLANFKAGRYNITLKKDGYQDYSGTVRVNAEKTATVRAQLIEIPKPPPPVVEKKKEEPVVQPGMLVELGPGVTPPKAIKKTYAKYPEAAKAKKISGTVNLRVLVSENGQVLDIKVLQSPHPLLEQAAVNTVRNWVYQPASKQGVPVKVWVPVSMAFQVSNQ